MSKEQTDKLVEELAGVRIRYCVPCRKPDFPHGCKKCAEEHTKTIILPILSRNGLVFTSSQYGTIGISPIVAEGQDILTNKEDTFGGDLI